MGTKVSKLFGRESCSAPPAGIAETIGLVDEVDEGISTGMLYHLEYIGSVYKFQVQERETGSQRGFVNGFCLPGFF